MTSDCARISEFARRSPRGKQAAEVVHDFVGVETDGVCVIADERAGEKTTRPQREVVALEPHPEVDGHICEERDVVEGNTAALALASQARAESFLF
jgi:hypothetical protein